MQLGFHPLLGVCARVSMLQARRVGLGEVDAEARPVGKEFQLANMAPEATHAAADENQVVAESRVGGLLRAVRRRTRRGGVRLVAVLANLQPLEQGLEERRKRRKSSGLSVSPWMVPQVMGSGALVPTGVLTRVVAPSYRSATRRTISSGMP